MIRCVLVASVALHVGLMAVLPDASRARGALPVSSSLVEIANEPSPAPPPPPPPPPSATVPAPAAEPMTAHAAPTQPRNAAPVHAMPAAPIEAPSSTADGDGPADFTQTVMSNARSASASASKVVVNTAPAEPKIVPVSSLSRRPGAPGLDAELERNYPVDARRAGISGTAKLRVQILSDGRVGKVERVLESHPGFADACTKTVRAARWEPPLDADGRAVATEIVYVCKFEVRS